LIYISQSLYLSGRKRFAAFYKSGVDDSSTGSVIIERPVRVTGAVSQRACFSGEWVLPPPSLVVAAAVKEDRRRTRGGVVF
jgi:hypothetical protein